MKKKTILKPMSRKNNGKTILDISSVLEMEEIIRRKNKLKNHRNYA